MSDFRMSHPFCCCLCGKEETLHLCFPSGLATDGYPSCFDDCCDTNSTETGPGRRFAVAMAALVLTLWWENPAMLICLICVRLDWQSVWRPFKFLIYLQKCIHIDLHFAKFPFIKLETLERRIQENFSKTYGLKQSACPERHKPSRFMSFVNCFIVKSAPLSLVTSHGFYRCFSTFTVSPFRHFSVGRQRTKINVIFPTTWQTVTPLCHPRCWCLEPAKWLLWCWVRCDQGMKLLVCKEHLLHPFMKD